MSASGRSPSRPWWPSSGLGPRIPSRREIAQAFLACLFPIQLWAMLAALNEMPAWLLQMSLWDVLGAVSYTQAFALLESVIVFAPLLALALALPGSWFRDRFVALTTGAVYLSAAWFVLAHLNEEALRGLGVGRQLLPWLALFLASHLVLFAAIQRSRRLERLIASFVDRMSVLAAIYLLLALAAVAIVVLRNI